MQITPGTGLLQAISNLTGPRPATAPRPAAPAAPAEAATAGGKPASAARAAPEQETAAPRRNLPRGSIVDILV